MPIYQYVCPECKQKIEIIQKINDEPPTCSKCKIKFKKIISKCSFVFKGSGWGADGYSKNEKRKSKNSNKNIKD